MISIPIVILSGISCFVAVIVLKSVVPSKPQAKWINNLSLIRALTIVKNEHKNEEFSIMHQDIQYMLNKEHRPNKKKTKVEFLNKDI